MRAELVIGWPVNFSDIKASYISKDENGNKNLNEEINENDVDHYCYLTSDKKWYLVCYETNTDDVNQWYIYYHLNKTDSEGMNATRLVKLIKKIINNNYVESLHTYLRENDIDPNICKIEDMNVMSVITNFYHD
jgi:hypothetical protein